MKKTSLTTKLGLLGSLSLAGCSDKDEENFEMARALLSECDSVDVSHLDPRRDCEFDIISMIDGRVLSRGFHSGGEVVGGESVGIEEGYRIFADRGDIMGTLDCDPDVKDIDLNDEVECSDDIEGLTSFEGRVYKKTKDGREVSLKYDGKFGGDRINGVITVKHKGKIGLENGRIVYIPGEWDTRIYCGDQNLDGIAEWVYIPAHGIAHERESGMGGYELDSIMAQRNNQGEIERAVVVRWCTLDNKKGVKVDEDGDGYSDQVCEYREDPCNGVMNGPLVKEVEGDCSEEYPDYAKFPKELD